MGAIDSTLAAAAPLYMAGDLRAGMTNAHRAVADDDADPFGGSATGCFAAGSQGRWRRSIARARCSGWCPRPSRRHSRANLSVHPHDHGRVCGSPAIRFSSPAQSTGFPQPRDGHRQNHPARLLDRPTKPRPNPCPSQGIRARSPPQGACVTAIGTVPVRSSKRPEHALHRQRWRQGCISSWPFRMTAPLSHTGQHTPSSQRYWRTSAKRLASSRGAEGLTRSEPAIADAPRASRSPTLARARAREVLNLVSPSQPHHPRTP